MHLRAADDREDLRRDCQCEHHGCRSHAPNRRHCGHSALSPEQRRINRVCRTSGIRFPEDRLPTTMHSVLRTEYCGQATAAGACRYLPTSCLTAAYGEPPGARGRLPRPSRLKRCRMPTMLRDRDRTALLFLPRSLCHRFRESVGSFVCQRRTRGSPPRTAPSGHAWRSLAGCASRVAPR